MRLLEVAAKAAYAAWTARGSWIYTPPWDALSDGGKQQWLCAASAAIRAVSDELIKIDHKNKNPTEQLDHVDLMDPLDPNA